jgi:hypothetical protein
MIIKKTWYFFLLILIFYLSGCSNLHGEGTAENPYLISKLSDFFAMRNYLDVENIYFKQINDLDFKKISKRKGNKPVGNLSKPFSGVYDGGGFKIINYFSANNDDGCSGIFGYVKNGKIKNLIVENINLRGKKNVGGIAGYISNTEISNCSVNGEIFCENLNSGGLVGYSENGSSIYYSSFSGKLTGNSLSGGFAGVVIDSKIKFSFFNGNIVYNGENSAGFTGYSKNVIYESCYAKVNFTVSQTDFESFFHTIENTVIKKSYFSDEYQNSVESKLQFFISDDKSNSNFFSDTYFFTDRLQPNSVITGLNILPFNFQFDQSTFAGWDFNHIWKIEQSKSPSLRGQTVQYSN